MGCLASHILLLLDYLAVAAYGNAMFVMGISLSRLYSRWFERLIDFKYIFCYVDQTFLFHVGNIYCNNISVLVGMARRATHQIV